MGLKSFLISTILAVAFWVLALVIGLPPLAVFLCGAAVFLICVAVSYRYRPIIRIVFGNKGGQPSKAFTSIIINNKKAFPYGNWQGKNSMSVSELFEAKWLPVCVVKAANVGCFRFADKQPSWKRGLEIQCLHSNKESLLKLKRLVGARILIAYSVDLANQDRPKEFVRV